MEEDAKRADRAYERALADLRVAKEELRKRGQSLCQLREALIYAQQHHLSDSIVDAREREAGQAEQRYDEQNDIYRQANTTKTRAREELNRLRQDYNLTEKLYRAANAKHLSLRDSNDA